MTRNVIFVLSDEHQARAMGCAGHPIVKTPNLDALAARGTRFTNAITPSPICVPARASIATGLPVHQIRLWDNAMAYVGVVPSWMHLLRDAGIRTASIGKLHFRSEADDTGFGEEIVPMHIKDGIGMVWGSVRNPLPDVREDTTMLGEVGPGTSNYNRYDEAVRNETLRWLRAAGSEPFALQVGFVAPHFPLVVPDQYLSDYPPEDMPLPQLRPETGYVRHPWLEAQEAFMRNEDEFGPDDDKRRLAIACYYGLTTMLDAFIGDVLRVLDETGLAEDTLVVYASDHGESLGERGRWGKSNLYTESVDVPLIVTGPGVKPGVCATAANLTDVAPTILETLGVEHELPGRSLTALAAQPDDPNRASFSEYHAVGAPSGAFLLRRGRWAYHHYLGFEDALFDLEADPLEVSPINDDRQIEAMREALFAVCDPVAVDRLASADQAALVERFGGRAAAYKTGTPGATPPPSV